ncbi:alpha/beta-hydrolase family protein [Tsukamurella sp. 1534]|uniref:alpha/beta hydrolase n=1 Tax=Tsukamurella sp. 1534 TaxID=1151061 RepID=UPI0002D3507B|nr:alpha/beta-hydrolase family protein [Tsukamurella sp. 1534]
MNDEVETTVDEAESSAGGSARPAAGGSAKAVVASSALSDRFGRWWKHRYTFTGTAVGLVFLWLSLTPSLLPRGPLFQSLVSGGSGAIGYMIGVFAVWLVRFMRSQDSSPAAPQRAWWALIGVGAVGTVGMILFFDAWQTRLRDMMSVEYLRFVDYLEIGVLSIVILYLFVELGKGVRTLVRWLSGRLTSVCPSRVAAVVAVGLVIVVGVGVVNGVIVRGAMDAMNTAFSKVNREGGNDRPAPTSEHRSGGPGSQVEWSSLGKQGRVFVSNAQTVEHLSAFNGAPAVEPIRAYAGLGSADSDDPNRYTVIAEKAAQELVRTGGLQRKVIAVAATTGTGWVNEAEAGALEYMYNGDTAIVSMQYSFLPSWLSFLVDKQNALEAGQALFEAVDRKVKALPEGARPKLVVFGESLGSFGGEAPFLSPNNILARTDGALFSGPTFNNEMWVQMTRQRDAGTPEWLPVYQQGANIRFAARAEDLATPAAPWNGPRVVYLQHASDPIGRWKPELAFSKPDWLREKRGVDVLSSVSWIPIVTFLQVSADMAVAVNVPDGHGHSYVKAAADAWAAILEPPGWTAEKTARLRPMLNSQTGYNEAPAG